MLQPMLAPLTLCKWQPVIDHIRQRKEDGVTVDFSDGCALWRVYHSNPNVKTIEITANMILELGEYFDTFAKSPTT